MSIILMICFARSGGTILNKCLGSLPNVVMVSEVNPLGGGKGLRLYQTIKSQAKHWYGIDLISDDNDFVGSALELGKICKETNRKLIIRDWTSVNFFPFKINNFTPPQRFLSLNSLRDQCELVPFVFVRDAIDVWFSYKRLRNYGYQHFFKHYLTYVKAIKNINCPIYKYEDFTLDYERIIKDICDYTGLQCCDSFKNFNSFNKVNGDIQFGKQSRGARQKGITPLSRKIINREEVEVINKCVDMVRANQLLNYSTFYEAKEKERYIEKVLDSIYCNIFRFLKIWIHSYHKIFRILTNFILRRFLKNDKKN